MPLQQFTAQLTQRNEINQNYLYLHFELLQPYRIEFSAGQYILLDVPGLDAKRQYSIASEPQMNHGVELLVDLIPGGKGSGYLASLNLGDEIKFRAPVGVFVVEEQDNESELVFVATGSGIAPIRSMVLNQLISRSNKAPIKLYWGMRHESDLFWGEDFYSLTEQHSNFKFELILSKPSPEWNLSQGYVTDLLEGFQTNFSDAGFYLCGNKNMLTQVSQYLLDKGAQEDRVHTEQFYD